MLNTFKRKDKHVSAEAAFEKLAPIQQIWLNTSTSREEFRAAYVPPLYRIFTAIESKARKEYLSHLTFALARARMGSVLGSHLPFEDQALNRDAYTYALVMAPLLYTHAVESCRMNCCNDTPSLYATSIAKEILGEKGFLWLQRFPVVYSDFLNYFSNPIESEIHAFISKVVKHNPALNEKRKALKLPGVVFSLRDGIDPLNVIKKDDEVVAATPADYIAWINEGLDQGSLIVGESGSIIYGLDTGDYFLVLDDCFQCYVEATGRRTKRLRKKLRDEGYLKIENGRDFFFARIDNNKTKGVVLLSAYVRALNGLYGTLTLI